MTVPAGCTVVDERNRRFLMLRVTITLDDAADAVPNESSWRADVSDAASPLAGLYTFADSYTAARDSIAETAWAAVSAGELLDFDISPLDLAGIYVVTNTTEVYDADALTAAINDAA